MHLLAHQICVLFVLFFSLEIQAQSNTHHSLAKVVPRKRTPSHVSNRFRPRWPASFRQCSSRGAKEKHRNVELCLALGHGLHDDGRGVVQTKNGGGASSVQSVTVYKTYFC